MKIKIVYEYDTKYATKFWAKTRVGESLVIEGSLKSFDEAKGKLIAAVSKMLSACPDGGVPEPEEVEIEEAINANQS
jgi:hypothetical protein